MRTLTEETPTGIVHVREENAMFPPVVAAVANDTMQSPLDATATVTPDESLTVDAQKPEPTLAALAFCT
jgi:hypothetical protein